MRSLEVCPDSVFEAIVIFSVTIYLLAPSVQYSHSVMSDSVAPRFLCPWNSPGKNTGVGCHSLLQGIFLTQGLNPGLLHCRQTLYRLSHWRSAIGWWYCSVIRCFCQFSRYIIVTQVIILKSYQIAKLPLSFLIFNFCVFLLIIFDRLNSWEARFAMALVFSKVELLGNCIH